MSQPTAFVLTHESNPKRTSRSTSLQALTITRSLGRRGVRVIRVHPNRLELSLLSRYCAGVEICPNVYESETALLQFLLDLAKKYDSPRVLFPASDDTAFFLGLHREPLLQAFRVPAASKSAIEHIINKRIQYGEAQKLGIPIPETYFPGNLEEVRALAGQLQGYPYVIKPNVAHRWRLSWVQDQLSSLKKGTTTKGVVVRSAEELVTEYEKIAHGDPDVMIQEVIGGEDELLYTFLGYFDAQSQPLGYCVRSKMRQYPLKFGYCTLTVSCENPTVVEQSVRLLQGLNYHGIVGVEYKHDPKTDRYKLIEINARAVNTSAIAPACGVDLPYIAFRDAIGQPLEPVTRWKNDVKWIWMTQDIFAARELNRQQQMTFRQWLQSIKGKRVHAVFASDDLRPVAYYLAEFFGTHLPKLLSKLLRGGAKR
jgi:predicted ATP-grasp superfamily ATP-dependent carboligase